MARRARKPAREQQTVVEGFARAMHQHRDEWVGSLASTADGRYVRIEVTVPVATFAKVLLSVHRDRG